MMNIVTRALRFAKARAVSPLDVRRRRRPLAEHFRRGQPIDRYYIENFIARQRDDVRGSVLEVYDRNYTLLFGGPNVTASDVLHAVQGNPLATIVGDLVTGENIPESAYDCVIMTQVYPFIYGFRSAIETTYNALKPGGVLLATLPSISQMSRYDAERWGDFWRFTDMSARRLFGGIFGEGNIAVESYGNVLAASAFLYRLGSHELTRAELDDEDQDYPVIITVRATK
jgi:hypothetical protein